MISSFEAGTKSPRCGWYGMVWDGMEWWGTGMESFGLAWVSRVLLEVRWVGGSAGYVYSNDFVSVPILFACSESSTTRLCSVLHYLGFAFMVFCVRLMKPRWRRKWLARLSNGGEIRSMWSGKRGNGETGGARNWKQGAKSYFCLPACLLLNYQPQKWTSPYL